MCCESTPSSDEAVVLTYRKQNNFLKIRISITTYSVYHYAKPNQRINTGATASAGSALFRKNISQLLSVEKILSLTTD